MLLLGPRVLLLLLLPMILDVAIAGGQREGPEAAASAGSASPLLLDGSPWAKTACGGGGEASLVETDAFDGSSVSAGRLSRARTASSTAMGASDAPRPHIVVFVADDQGYSVHAAGRCV